MLHSEHILSILFWSAMTIGFYLLGKMINKRFPSLWTSPLIFPPALLIVLATILHVNYKEYISSTHWLIALLGPAIVAFAVPIYEQRATIRRFWPVLTVGIVVGSITAMVSAWLLASLLGVDGITRISLLPRSISTPFAMAVSSNIGGVPNLTALFVIVTGVLGAALGETLLVLLPFRSNLARGALLGMGAHAAGVAKASQFGQEETSIAGLVMVLAGIVNVLSAPLIHLVLSAV